MLRFLGLCSNEMYNSGFVWRNEECVGIEIRMPYGVQQVLLGVKIRKCFLKFTRHSVDGLLFGRLVFFEKYQLVEFSR